jgi:anion-transporting  ArsA/GET3 family ATPase
VNPAIGGLLERRLLVVAGKGGVGKTTIACALGVIAAQHGKRVLLAEVDGAGRAARLLGAEPAPVGQAREVRPGLAVMAVDGLAALAEYLQIIVPVKRVLQAVFSSRIYQYFVAAAPGLKELMTIGKIWYEAERVDDASGRHLWDIVILDAPATGHSLQYLRMPHAALDAFKGGLVGRESRRLVQLLTDPRRTAINLVTTAEEMPVNETLEMYTQVREQLCMPFGCLFVNRVHTRSFAAGDLQRLEERLAALRDRRARTLVAEVLQRAREETGWTAINRFYIERLGGAVAAPLLQVPFVFTEEFGGEQVRAIARMLSGADDATARTRSDAAR